MHYHEICVVIKHVRSLFSYQTDEDVAWTEIKRHASEAIANFFESGDPITVGAVHHESSEFIVLVILELCVRSCKYLQTVNCFHCRYF